MKVYCILSDERAFQLKSPAIFSSVLEFAPNDALSLLWLVETNLNTNDQQDVQNGTGDNVHGALRMAPTKCRRTGPAAGFPRRQT